VLFPLLLIVDLLAPGWPAGRSRASRRPPAALRAPYLAALAAPVFALSVFAVVALARGYLGERRRLPERFETLLESDAAATAAAQEPVGGRARHGALRARAARRPSCRTSTWRCCSRTSASPASAS
jgi:hypothetical protein